jgi:hypothetical protein
VRALYAGSHREHDSDYDLSPLLPIAMVGAQQHVEACITEVLYVGELVLSNVDALCPGTSFASVKMGRTLIDKSMLKQSCMHT